MCKKTFLNVFFSVLFMSVSFGLSSQEASVPLSDDPALLDPTKPSGFIGGFNSGKLEKPGMLRLEAIIISDTERRAVINQKILEVGDTVGSKTVTAIEDNQVVLREGIGKDKKEIVLPLWDSKMKDESL